MADSPTMTAVRVHRHGPPDVLVYERAVPRPQPAAGQVLVRIHRAAVAAGDVELRAGRSPQARDLRMPLVLGTDMAGTIAALGKGVTSFRLGDEVYGAVSPQLSGSNAQFGVAEENSLVRRPATLSLTEAAAVPTGACMAAEAVVELGKMARGRTMLVHGAAGSIGSFAVQLARKAGGRVLCTASREGMTWVRALGADQVMERRGARFEEIVGRIDVVLDLVGGETRRRSWRVLRPDGLMVVCAASVTDQDELAAKAAGVRLAAIEGTVTAQRLHLVDELFLKGELAKPRVGAMLPLADVRRAHELIEVGEQPPGRVVLTVT